MWRPKSQPVRQTGALGLSWTDLTIEAQKAKSGVTQTVASSVQTEVWKLAAITAGLAIGAVLLFKKQRRSSRKRR